MFNTHLCLQIGWGFLRPLTLPSSGRGFIDVHPYRHADKCGGQVSNSIFHKEYTLDDPQSVTVLDEVSKIVSSSTYFTKIGGCANNQFMAKWAFEVTWIEIVDESQDCTIVSCAYIRFYVAKQFQND